ncbi:hypothetical protein [Shinella sp. PSBB067]
MVILREIDRHLERRIIDPEHHFAGKPQRFLAVGGDHLEMVELVE